MLSGGAGYAFATNSYGSVIFHPQHDLTSTRLAHITEYEGSFFDMDSDFYSQSIGEAEYIKDGQLWYVSWSTLTVADYYIAIVAAHVTQISCSFFFLSLEIYCLFYVSSLKFYTSLTSEIDPPPLKK